MSLRSYKPPKGGMPSEGASLGVLVEFIDLGTAYSEKYDKNLRQVRLTWELEELMKDGTPFVVSRTYTLSLYGNGKNKSKLRADLEALRGREFKEQELKDGVDFSKLLGQACMLTITHKESNGRTYANIASIGAVPKGQRVPELFNELKFLDLSAFDQEVFDSLPEWVKKRIEESDKYKMMQEISTSPPDDEIVESDDDEGQF